MKFIFLIIVFVSIPTVVWFGIRSFLPKWFRVPLYAAAVAVIFYLFILVSAAYSERKAEADILEFDQVHAGMELTSEEKEERQRLILNIIHDTGRTFAPITGALGAIIYFVLIWVSIFFIARYKFVSMPKD